MESISENYKNIKGWGIDQDPKDEPNYPIKNYNGDDHNRLNWQRPPLQPQTVEILKSVEHPRMPAVFGTPNPPSGLSGILRRIAFKYDESEYRHWLNLLLADRINVVEGIVEDIRNGHFPNIFYEKGMKADWKYNRKELVSNMVIASVLITSFCFLLSMKKKKKSQFKRDLSF